MPFSLVAGKADKPLFVFGSLIDHDLLELVLGRSLPGGSFLPANAQGFTRVFAQNENYPILIEAAGLEQQGLLIKGLTETDLARLQFYETCEYALSPLEVQVTDGIVMAQVFRHTAEIAPSDTAWNFEAWTRNDKPLALATTKDGMAWFGKVDLHTFEVMWDDIEDKARAKLEGATAS